MSNRHYNSQTTNQHHHPGHSSGDTSKVEKTMHEFKEGTLRTSSGEKVENPKQAIAIGLSEQRAKDKKK